MTIDLRDHEIIEKITGVRMANNVLWMRLVTIALENSADETREVLGRINENDQKISALMKDMAK